jgi:hypothetical protein
VRGRSTFVALGARNIASMSNFRQINDLASIASTN